MKKLVLTSIILVFSTSLYLSSCKQPAEKKLKVQFAKDDLPRIDDTIRNAKIIWDKSEQKVSHEEYFAEYGRARRYSGDTVMLIYHSGPKGHEWDNIALRRSVKMLERPGVNLRL